MHVQDQYEEVSTELGDLQQQHLELQRQLQSAAAEKQRLQEAVAKAESEATLEEGGLRKTISDLTSTREQEKKEVRRVLLPASAVVLDTANALSPRLMQPTSGMTMLEHPYSITFGQSCDRMGCLQCLTV